MQLDTLGSFVNIEDAAREVGLICNAYKTVDIDLTILLTHIGFEEDKRLAAILDPEWGIDLIIGGHTHTILDEPAEVNGILVTQAGIGTNQIGRFDIVIDTDTNKVHEYTWQLIPITPAHCPRDLEIESTVLRFKDEVDAKYNRVLCRFAKSLTHPSRYEETELGNLLADILQSELRLDIMMLGSGSVRKKSIPTIFTLLDLRELFPFDDKVMQLTVTGAQLKKMLAYVFREEMFEHDHTEYYQYSTGFRLVYNRGNKDFDLLELGGKPLEPDTLYTIALQEFHYMNFNQFFNFPIEEVYENAKPRILATSIFDILLEYFSTASLLDAEVEGRIVVVE
jgi:5'-nucleotidase